MSLKLYIKIAILFNCIISAQATEGQTFSISFPINSKVYAGSEIPLTVIVEGATCSNTVITSKNGILSNKNGCAYTYRGKEFGLDTIQIFIRKNGQLKKIGEKIIPIDNPPLPRASFGNKIDGNFSKGAFIAQGGVAGAWYLGAHHWQQCKIDSFRIIVLRNDIMVLTYHNKSNIIGPELREKLDILQSGDRIIFTDIKGCVSQGGGDLKSLEFRID